MERGYQFINYFINYSQNFLNGTLVIYLVSHDKLIEILLTLKV